LGLGVEQILLAQLVKRVGDQVFAHPGEKGKFSHVALSVAMPPNAGRDRAQAMSDLAVSIVDEELLADRLYQETLLTRSC
jgi:hypothetical protein